MLPSLQAQSAHLASQSQPILIQPSVQRWHRQGALPLRLHHPIRHTPLPPPSNATAPAPGITAGTPGEAPKAAPAPTTAQSLTERTSQAVHSSKSWVAAVVIVILIVVIGGGLICVIAQRRRRAATRFTVTPTPTQSPPTSPLDFCLSPCIALADKFALQLVPLQACSDTAHSDVSKHTPRP